MTEAPVSPLRRRMIESMRMRKLAPRTQEGHIRAISGALPHGPRSGLGARFAKMMQASHYEQWWPGTV
jgi:hypothetical protein